MRVVPDYVGMHGHIGIGGINAIHYFRGSYFVSIRLPTCAKVDLHLTEDRGGLVCLNSAARFDKWNHAAVR